ncbi:hypothetical protein VTH06DRAFT_3332 [Thermothelomyces fergusii]
MAPAVQSLSRAQNQVPGDGVVFSSLSISEEPVRASMLSDFARRGRHRIGCALCQSRFLRLTKFWPPYPLLPLLKPFYREYLYRSPMPGTPFAFNADLATKSGRWNFLSPLRCHDNRVNIR